MVLQRGRGGGRRLAESKAVSYKGRYCPFYCACAGRRNAECTSATAPEVRPVGASRSLTSGWRHRARSTAWWSRRNEYAVQDIEWPRIRQPDGIASARRVGGSRLIAAHPLGAQQLEEKPDGFALGIEGVLYRAAGGSDDGGSRRQNCRIGRYLVTPEVKSRAKRYFLADTAGFLRRLGFLLLHFDKCESGVCFRGLHLGASMPDSGAHCCRQRQPLRG